MQTLFFQRFDQHYAPRTGAKRSMSDIASSDQVSEIAKSEPGIGGMSCLAGYMIYYYDSANGSKAMAICSYSPMKMP